MENDRIAEMQAYLKREIADTHYDPEAFTNFISSKKDCGEDLENWTLDEVQQVVAEFKQQHSPLSQSQQLPEGSAATDNLDTVVFGEKLIEGMQDILEQLPPAEETGDAADASLEQTPAGQLKNAAHTFNELNRNFSEKVTCHKLPANKLGLVGKLHSSISGERLVKGGFFTKSFTTYLIVTTGDSGTLFEVERRFSQFDALRQTLVRDFPGVYIPPIARKQLKNYEEAFLKNRFDTLKRFLQALASHQVLKHSPHFEAFVTIKDEKEYLNACAAIDKNECKYQFFASDFSIHNFSSGFKASQFRNLTGEFDAKINSTFHTLALSSEQFFRDADPVLQNLKAKLLEVDASIEKTVTLLSESSGLFGRLSSLTGKYRTSTNEIQDSWDGLSTVFGEYQTSVQHLGSEP